MVKMNTKAYMTRGKKLVSLSLQNDPDLQTSDPTDEVNETEFFPVANQEDLVQPEDYGFNTSFSIPDTSAADNLDLEWFEDFNQNILTCSVAKPTSGFNGDDYIENSQDIIYTELQCPSKKRKMMDISAKLIEKPKITVPETPYNSESETDTFYNEVSTDDGIWRIQQNDSESEYMMTTASTQNTLTTTTDVTQNPQHRTMTTFESPAVVALQHATTSTVDTLCQSSDTTGVLETQQNTEITINAAPTEREQQTRQRKSTVKFPSYSKEEKITKSREKHQMLIEDCGFKCHRDCREFNIERRTDIWNAYWTLSHGDQIKWLARYIHLQPVKIHTTKENDEENFRKNETRTFYLPYTDGTTKQVCKKMFLNTFGYKNDSIVTTLSKKIKDQDTTSSLTDKRGTHDKPKIDTTVIKKFINLYKPCTAHYRRHNTPNMKYLGQDITIQKLYEDFKEMYPEFKCCKEILRRTLKEMHISLHRPKSDKCFDCLSFETSISENLKAREVPSLKLLCKKVVHKNKAKEATDAYSYDASREKTIDERIYSMDLQKSVLLPMMPEVKDCFFTNRMIGFNLTFCGLSKDSKEGSKCLVWHEATGGRDGKDIIDAIHKLILSERDIKDFIFWADNCCAQNKNWILFTALVTIVNLHDGLQSITIKYLTKGHTHMSADGVHGNIEKNFRRVKNIYDFEDYKDCLETSRKANKVIEIIPQEKRAWVKKKKAQMEPVMLTDLVEVKFVKGQRSVLYKKVFHESSYSELDFLQKRFKITQLPNKIQGVRGLRSSKKSEIMEKLVPIMPSKRRLFWEGLPENDSSVDLISGGQEEASS